MSSTAPVVGRETVQYVPNIYKYYIASSMYAEREAERLRGKQRPPYVPDRVGPYPAFAVAPLPLPRSNAIRTGPIENSPALALAVRLRR